MKGLAALLSIALLFALPAAAFSPAVPPAEQGGSHGDGANCSAGSYTLGVGGDGAAQDCTDATTEIDSAVSAHGGVADAHHTATVETNDLESVATSVGDAEVFVGTGANVGAYIAGLAACAADEKPEYVPGSPDTFTCEAIGGLVDADVADDITITNLAQVQDVSASASEINAPLDGASVTLTEFRELEAIGDTTISAGQWGYLGGLDQGLATTSNVTFGSVTVTPHATEGGYSRVSEGADDGSNYHDFKAPDSGLSGDKVCTFEADGEIPMSCLGTGAVTTHGVVAWGNGADASFDIGNEICAALGLTCQTTHELDGTNQICTYDHAGYFYAFCY